MPSTPSTGLTLKLPPLQIALVRLLIAGVGLTVTVTVNEDPVHGPAGDCGVTVYVAVPATLPELVSVPFMVAPALPTPPATVALITGGPHVYVVPAGTIPLVPLRGVKLKFPPLHIVAVMALTAGIGLTVTVIVNAAPVHAAVDGVTVYVAVCTALVGLTRVPEMSPASVPAAPPVIPPVTTGAAHVYAIPAGIIPSVRFMGAMVKLPPLQMVAVWLLTAGLGFTVTVTVNGVPVQLAVEGVTLYVAVPAVLRAFVRVPVIVNPDPARPPVIPALIVGADQL